MAVASLTVDLNASTVAFQQAMNQATRTLETFGKNTDSVMARLKASLGPRSGLKDFVEVLKGGGAVAGLALAGTALRDLTTKAIALREEIQAGTKSSVELAQALLESVPVFGAIAEAGRNLHELATGEQAALKAANDRAAELAQFSAEIAANFKAAAKAVGELKERLAGRKANIATAGAVAPFDEFRNIQKQGITNTASVRDFASAKIEEILNPKGGIAYEALRNRAKKLRDDLNTPIPALQVSRDYGANTAAVTGAVQKREAARASLPKVMAQLREREAEANKVIAQANENIAFEIAEGWKVWSTTFAKSAKEAWGGLMKSNANSPFKLISDSLAGGKSILEAISQQANILYGASGIDRYINAVRGQLTKPQREISVPPAVNMPSRVQPAREFYFTEGIPGGRANPIDRLTKATEENARETRRNNERLRENNELLRKQNNEPLFEIP